MRKFFFSMKTLALTLALVVGGSAWAQITSLPFVADYSDTESPAPFGEPAFVTGNDAIGKVVAVVNGTAEASFAVDGGAYVLSNAEEVTVSFTMYNGWLGGGANNTFAVLNSEGVTLASLSYNANDCNIVDVTLAGKTVEDFVVFAGQGSVGSKGSNGYANDKQQGFIANTESVKNNGVVTIKINSFGGVSLSFVGGKGNVNNTYSATVAEGTKLDLAKLTIANGSNNGDRATGYGDLTVTSRSMIKVSQDYSDGVADWKSDATDRYTVNINEGEYLTVDAVGNGNNGTTVTGSTVNGKAAAGENFTSSEDYTLSFDIQLTGGNDQNTMFHINDASNTKNADNSDPPYILSLRSATPNGTVWQINGSETQTIDLAKTTWYTFTLTKYGKDLFLSVAPTEGGDALLNQQKIAVNSTDGGLGNMMFRTKRYYAYMAIDNVVLRDVVESIDIPETPVYTYTVKYETEDGEQVKDPVEREEYEGVELAILDEDKETVVVGKSQYTYISDDAEGQTAAADGSTVITVLFEKTTVSDYVVKYVTADGTELQEATTHKNALVDAEVTASAGEMSKILVEGVIYEYASGNEPITVAEDETKNVITLVFAPVEGVTGYYLQTYETATAADWTTANGGRFDPVLIDGNVVAKASESGEFGNMTTFLAAKQDTRDQNGSTITSNALDIDEEDFTFEARLLLGSPERDLNSFNVINKAGNGNIFTITPTAASATTWVINGKANVELPKSGNVSTKGGPEVLLNYSWYDFKVTVYKGYTFVTVTGEDGNTILDMEQVPTLATTYGISKMQLPTGRYHGNFAIDDVLVRSVAEDDIPAGFSTVVVTINYVDTEGKTVKPSDTVEFAPGEIVTLTSAYTSDFKVDAEGAVWTAESESAPVTKYIYKSDNSEEVVAEEGAEVNVVFRGVGSRRVAMRYQYQHAETNEMMTKNAAGTNLPFFYDSNVAGDILFEGDVQRIYHPYYLLVDGYLYKAEPRLEGSNILYCIDYTVPEGTGTLSTSPITWTPATEIVVKKGEEGEEDVEEEVLITNAIFAEETENISGMTEVKDGYTAIRMANGAAGSAIGGDVLVTTLQPGKYTITTASRSGTTNFLVDGNVVCTVSTSGTVTTVTSEEFEVTKPTALYIQEQTATTQYSDYVLIRKTGDVEASYVYLSNYAVTCDGEFGEEGTVVAVVTYDIDIVGEYTALLDVYFTCDVTNAEGEVVATNTINPQEGIESGTVNVSFSDLQPQTEYTVTVTKVMVTDFDMDIFDTVTLYSEEGTLATATFKTGVLTGITNVETAPAVKADGKYLENGQIVIYRGGVKYNAAGAVIR